MIKMVATITCDMCGIEDTVTSTMYGVVASLAEETENKSIIAWDADYDQRNICEQCGRKLKQRKEAGK